MDVHLDLFGGMAGDMFIAALLDACPQYEQRVLDVVGGIEGASLLTCMLLSHRDQVLQGRRFKVMVESAKSPAPLSSAATDHSHVTWRSVRRQLQKSSLDAGVLRHALGIFELLAAAEAFVHGVAVEDVQFHEVGAWDSIADIVGAAVLIDAIGAGNWSYSAAPLGSGEVKTAHGMLPVPAPATTRLLIGMRTTDDGVGGERVTPTGAAILRYLCGPERDAQHSSPAGVRTLSASGTGFGFRTLAGRSNHLRVLCFENSSHERGGHRELCSIEFEVDDQSGEDLAAGLGRLRAHRAVLDVTQGAVFGKKNRMMAHIRVLGLPAQTEEVVDACFRETTTIGLRVQTLRGIGLQRTLHEVEIDGQRVRVKVVDRPGGKTAKAESDDLQNHAHHSQRHALRARAEMAVLEQDELR